MPPAPTWRIDWSKPLYFQEPGIINQAMFVTYDENEAGQEIVRVDDPGGREYCYMPDAAPVGHGRYIANVPHHQRVAQGKVRQSRERAKRLKEEEEARIREQRDLAGDCYGIF